MNLSEIKNILQNLQAATFKLPDGTTVPSHFHITEVGKIEKHFIDCGGTERRESAVSLQLWSSNDYDHRLSAEKLKSILLLSEEKLGLKDDNIEVEYQSDTIGKYDLAFDGLNFQLLPKQTDCLAKDNCGIPKQKVELNSLNNKAESCCAPESGCC